MKWFDCTGKRRFAAPKRNIFRPFLALFIVDISVCSTKGFSLTSDQLKYQIQSQIHLELWALTWSEDGDLAWNKRSFSTFSRHLNEIVEPIFHILWLFIFIFIFFWYSQLKCERRTGKLFDIISMNLIGKWRFGARKEIFNCFFLFVCYFSKKYFSFSPHFNNSVISSQLKFERQIRIRLKLMEINRPENGDFERQNETSPNYFGIIKSKTFCFSTFYDSLISNQLQSMWKTRIKRKTVGPTRSENGDFERQNRNFSQLFWDYSK